MSQNKQRKSIAYHPSNSMKQNCAELGISSFLPFTVGECISSLEIVVENEM